MEPISLAAARVNAGLTRTAAAERFNITRKTLDNWEFGRSFPPADKLVDILGVYNCKFEDINFFALKNR